MRNENLDRTMDHLAEGKLLILDGGLATEMEARGLNLDDPLWSFRQVMEAPAVVKAVHRSYLEAGADIILAASYQGTVQALQAEGCSVSEAETLLLRSVALAQEARATFLAQAPLSQRIAPLVAASIGPYGAYLADGSEYRGVYGLDAAALHAFHAKRFRLLAQSTADLLACETLPCLQEAKVLADLAAETAVPRTWLSFACRDGQSISDGTPFAACAELVAASPGVVALGINCTAPQHVSSLLRMARATGLSKPLVVYPNAGEVYHPATKSWVGDRKVEDFTRQAREWVALGAQVIGGCCRTGPGHVQALREAFSL